MSHTTLKNAICLGFNSFASTGECCAIQATKASDPVLLPGKTYLSDELASQVVAPPPKFVLISTAGELPLAVKF